MGFWNSLKSIGSRALSGAKRFVGSGYGLFKRGIGYARLALDKIESLKNIPEVAEIAQAASEANPELALTIGAGLAGAEAVVSSAEKGIDLIDRVNQEITGQTG